MTVEYTKHKNTIKIDLEEDKQLKNDTAKLKKTTEIQIQTQKSVPFHMLVFSPWHMTVQPLHSLSAGC